MKCASITELNIIKYVSKIRCKWKNKFSNEQYSFEVMSRQKCRSTKWIDKRENNSSDGEIVMEVKLM
jgi:hypothetical protein